MKINVINGTLPQDEIDEYVKRAREKYPDQNITSMDIKLDGDFVDIKYYTEPIKFQRIRRITGYLVGTLDNWNNAKRAEESQRVKHGF